MALAGWPYGRLVNDASPLLAKSAVAKLLGISTRTLDRMRAKRQIAWELIGGQVRFDPKEIERYRDSQRRSAASVELDSASIKEMFPIAALDFAGETA